MSTWVAQITYQTEMIRTEITAFEAWLRATDATDAERDSMLAPWQHLLATLEGSEMERARAMDAEIGGAGG